MFGIKAIQKLIIKIGVSKTYQTIKNFVKKFQFFNFIVDLQTAFNIGLSQYEHAEFGLKTLEKWNEQLDSNEMEEILKQVLPCLDDYLQSNIKGQFLIK